MGANRVRLQATADVHEFRTDEDDPKPSFEGWLNYQAVVVGPSRLAAKSVRRALWLTLT